MIMACLLTTFLYPTKISPEPETDVVMSYRCETGVKHECWECQICKQNIVHPLILKDCGKDTKAE